MSGGSAHADVHGHAGVANAGAHGSTVAGPGSSLASVLGSPASRVTSTHHAHLPHAHPTLSLSPASSNSKTRKGLHFGQENHSAPSKENLSAPSTSWSTSSKTWKILMIGKKSSSSRADAHDFQVCARALSLALLFQAFSLARSLALSLSLSLSLSLLYPLARSLCYSNTHLSLSHTHTHTHTHTYTHTHTHTHSTEHNDACGKHAEDMRSGTQ
jgi:hypothetical protein